MANYKVFSKETKHFTLTENENTLGNLTYAGWFTFKADISLLDNRTYHVEPKGFWGTTIEVKNEDEVLIDFKMNWKGNILINVKSGEAEKFYILKHKGFLKSSFVLLDAEDQELLVIEPDFKWSKFNYDYNIATTDFFEQFVNKNLLLLTTIHCTNYFMTMMTTAAAM